MKRISILGTMALALSLLLVPSSTQAGLSSKVSSLVSAQEADTIKDLANQVKELVDTLQGEQLQKLAQASGAKLADLAMKMQQDLGVSLEDIIALAKKITSVLDAVLTKQISKNLQTGKNIVAGIPGYPKALKDIRDNVNNAIQEVMDNASSIGINVRGIAQQLESVEKSIARAANQ